MTTQISTLSALSDDSTLVDGGTITHTEHNTHRTNYRTLINNLLSVVGALETHYASVSAPSDTPAGKLWWDSGNTILKLAIAATPTWRSIPRTAGTYDLVFTLTANTGVTLPTSGTLAALGGTNTWSGVNTFSNTTAATSSSAGAVILSGGLAAAKGIWVTGVAGSSYAAVFEQNSQAVPATGNFIGTAITAHYTSNGETSFWNGLQSASLSYTFYQKTSDSAATLLMTLDPNKNLLLGGATAAASSAVSTIHVKNGTANTAALTDGVTAYAADDGASKSAWHLVSENLTRYQLSNRGIQTIYAGGRIFNEAPNTSTSSATTVVDSWTLPANALYENGQALKMGFYFTRSAHAGTLTYQVRINSQSVIGAAYVGIDGVDYDTIEVTVTRASSSSAYFISFSAGNITNQLNTGTVVGSLDFTADQTIDVIVQTNSASETFTIKTAWGQIV